MKKNPYMSDSTIQPTPKARSLSLDAVRGSAILLVVIYHYKEFSLFPTPPGPIPPFLGMFGVDLFYVLSGFFITYAILSTHSWNPAAFLRSRVTRIYPAFIFSLAVFVILRLVAKHPIDKHLIINILLHLTMLHNLYPDIGSSLNGTYWTLGVEFPYYVLMLALGYFLRTSKTFWLASFIMVAISIIWRASAYLQIPTDAGRFFASTQLPGTLDAFAFGGIAAKVKYDGVIKRYLDLGRWPIFISGILLAAISLNYVANHAGHYWSYVWTAVFWRSGLAISFSLIIAGCSVMNYNKLLNYSGLPWLGKISFSLYIYHLWPALMISQYLKDIDWGWKLTLAGLFSTVVSWASWRFIEIRFHRSDAPSSMHQRPI